MNPYTLAVAALVLALTGCAGGGGSDYTVKLDPPKVDNEGSQTAAAPCVPGPESPSSCN
ncbi:MULTISPECIES: hypothetical protein [Larsenimonas]|uniref:Lipoprotein n=1 Tax=Larsenimonas suaedae TaxID=1851019 RepID=A0ABU1GVR1_9GAMM|nr:MULTISPECIES: hypothetical protein [Larsenimonas]MCM2971206.1 hypothetical protein [Larsenimonas suaedae]MCM5703314.1 hypothetical protein [Larsenimonas salina]MDR5895915.1 hypothetical protein [Larsenimonas suaedae]